MKSPKHAGPVMLVVMALLPTLLAGGQSEQQMAAWQRSWDAFVDEFQAHVSRGGKGSDFQEKVQGKVVIWEGTFRKVVRSSRQPYADIDFTRRRVQWDGVDYRIVRPPITLSSAELPQWEKLTTGSTIRVRVTLGTNNAFGGLFVLGPPNDEYLAFMAQEGELVEVVKKP